MQKNRHLKTILFTGLALVYLGACNSNDDDSDTSVPIDDGISSDGNELVPTVEAALADFPDALLPRFALSNSEVTAGEVFRQINYSDGMVTGISFGVEGATEDELLELEARYADTGEQLESVRNDIIETLPEPVDTALRARYPDAVINEIERSTSESGIAFAILLDTMGQEIEANYDDAATLLFVEDVEPREAIPADILALADAQNVTLPDAEWEITTFPDGIIEYAVEYENDAGQSITLAFDVDSDVVRVEHEDALSNLSSSETVEEALADYPDGIVADFSAMFSEVTAAEIFRSQMTGVNGEVTTLFGIEGLSEDELLEIEALYTPEVILTEQISGVLIASLPDEVESAFVAQYPDATIEEIVETTTENGTEFAVLLVTSDEEQEVNLDAAGSFISVEKALGEDEIPDAILEAIGAERVLLPIVEFESLTTADGTVAYEAEYENDAGDSISYKLDAAGNIIQTDHEAALVE